MSDNEQESEKREKVVDILAEMCHGMSPNGTVECQYLESDICTFADRIKIAVEREKAEAEANALAVGGIVEASRHTPGNAAAMREACVKIRRELNTYCNDCTLPDRMTEDPPDYTCLRDSLLEIERIVDAALSAPARNCDVMQLAVAKKVWFTKEIMPRLNGDLPLGEEISFEEWLFAPAAERKGEGK